jgi:glutathione peroxidase
MKDKIVLNKKIITSLKIVSLFITILFSVVIFVPLVAEAKNISKSAYDFEFVSIDGLPMKLADYKNKVLLVVNTASHCGFTGQYSDLQTLWSTYREKGLVVVGVPSGDFGSQEFGSNKKVKEFCSVNFNINFPMTAISRVTGNKAHPFFTWAVDNVGVIGTPRWNFHKFLIDPEGRVADWFSSTTRPLAGKITKAIEDQITNIKPM